MDAINNFQIFDWLWTSGQLSEEDIKRLPELGIETVINLALPTSTNALKNEAELVCNLHMNYFQIPVEWELPEVAQFTLFAELLQKLQGTKTWLHCAMNNRVSVFMYLYRKLIMNENEENAVFPMNEIWTPDKTWREFIDDVCNLYKKPDSKVIT